MLNMIKAEDVDGNDIKLPCGTIELYVEQGGWCTNYHLDITWHVSYHRPELNIYEYETCSSLEEALDWYNKQDLVAKDL